MKVREVSCTDIARVISDSWVDTSRKPWVCGGRAYIPVKDGYPYTAILPERRRNGRGYQRIGDIIAFHGEKPGSDLVSEIIAIHHPQAVIWYRGHTGEMRIPDAVVLYGTVSDTVHHEAGIRYHLNPIHVMFSQSNREEKRRVAALVKTGERICDMFAGIGYFTLSLAKAGGLVHALEINPDAIRYLCINIQENNLESRVIVTPGDCRCHMVGIYDRIHMGHFSAIRFLESALNHVHPGTVLHVHGIGDIREEIREKIEMLGYEAVLDLRIVKKIGPRKVHTVTDVVLS